MKRILTLCLLILFSFTAFAQTKPAAKPKLITAEQASVLQQAQQVRAQAELRAALAKAELEKVEAQIVALIREFAIQLKIDPDEYEIVLAEIEKGVVGFKPKPKPDPKPPEKAQP